VTSRESTDTSPEERGAGGLATATREAAPPGRRPAAEAGARRLRPRAILVGLLLIPFNAYWAAQQGVDVILSLMVPPVASLLLLCLWNFAIRRARSGTRPERGTSEGKGAWAFSEAELVVVYGMVTVATAIAAEWVGNINPLIASYALFQQNDRNFVTYILPHVPEFLFFTDPSGLADYKTGGYGWARFIERLPMWATPVLAWTLFVTLLAGAMLCINSLMREEWTDREKLAFPIIQLPMAMAQDGAASPFWRNPFMWGGFFAIAVIDTVNGLNFLYPSIPRLNVRFLGDLALAFPDPPFNAIGWTPIGLFPFITALAVFLPMDLLFSAIFFFFVRKAQQVVAASYGYPGGVFGGGWLVPAPPYFTEQSWGAFLGLFVTALWIARNYLREVWREIWTGRQRERRAVPHRWTFLGLLGCLLGLGGFGVATGLAPLLVVFYMAIFLAFSVAVTRLRSQLGPPTHEMAFMGPNQLIVDFNGTQGLSTPVIARLATQFHFLNRIHRTHPMPHMLEAMKMGERSHMSQRGLFLAILLAILAGSLAGHLVRIYAGYRWGAGGAGGDTAAVVQNLVGNPRTPNTIAMLFVGVGMGVVFLLDFVRFRVPWFPLHPAGYALAMNFGVDYYWFGLLVAFIVKGAVQRYSGLRGYRKLHNVALGVILGEFTLETVWAVIAMVNRYATYSISINGRLGWNQ
jgi:hypothetical protein